MTQSQHEHLSAFIDGELEGDAARFLMRRLENDAELRAAWQRWQLAGSCLRGQAGYHLPDSFAQGIADRLQGEPRPQRPGVAANVLRWTAGLAVAASVAMLALVVVQPGDPGSPTSSPMAGATPASEAVVEASPLRAEDLRPNLAPAAQTVSGVRTQLLGPAQSVDPRLDAYLIRHAAALGSENALQLVPYVHPLQAPQWPAPPAVLTDPRQTQGR